MKLSRTWIAIVLAVLVFTSFGCSPINRIRAKYQLNEAASAYRDNHLDIAEQRARRALELDPANKTAPLFLAAIIHKQSKHAPDNPALAIEAIGLYKNILQKDPANEEAYSAIADLYTQLHDETALRGWFMQRATDTSVPEVKRAQAYIILASKDHFCAAQITEPNKTVDAKGTVSYKKPKDDKDDKKFKDLGKCVEDGLREINSAINLLQDNQEAADIGSAWSNKARLLRDQFALLQMEGKLDQMALVDKAREAADQRTIHLKDLENQKKAAEAKKTPSPAAK